MNLSIATTLDCDVLAVGITICVSLTRGPRLGQPHLVTRSRINGGRGLLVVKLLGKFKVAGYACGWWGGVVSVIFILPSFQFVFDVLLGSSAKLRDHVHPADLRRDTPTIWRLQPLRWCIIVWSLFYSLLCELLELQGRSLEEMRGWVRTPLNCGKRGRKNGQFSRIPATMWQFNWWRMRLCVGCVWQGAGHTVPEYKPVEALAFFKRFLSAKPL